MTEKLIDEEENTAKENLAGIAQILIGEIETVGGILTGDPTTRAEGEFNVEVGHLRQESVEGLTRDKEDEESDE